MKTKYNYVVLRYIHDVVSGEFVNFGIVIVAPDVFFARAICTPKYQRISRFFQGVSGKHFRDVSMYLQTKIDQLAGSLSAKISPSEFPATAEQLIAEVLPKDDSSFQVSELKGGIADHEQVEALADELYERFVERYDRPQEPKSKNEDDVWRSFRPALERSRLSSVFHPHVIHSPHYEFEFKKVFQNGRLHVCQPISFDLASEDQISEKALLWYGRIAQLNEGNEQFKAYFLVGKPSESGLLRSYDNAKQILDEVPAEHQTFEEAGAEEFADTVQRELQAH
jgi:hypothetical protein